MLGAPPLGFCAIAAVAFSVLLASDSAAANLKSKLTGISEVMCSEISGFSDGLDTRSA